MTKEGLLPLFSSSSSSSSSAGWRNFRGSVAAGPKNPWSSTSSSSSSSSAWMYADTGSTATRATGNKFCLHSIPKGFPTGAIVCKAAASWPRSGAASPGGDDGKHAPPRDSASVTVLRSPGMLTSSSYPSSNAGAVRGGGGVSNKKTAASAAYWWDGKLVDANKDVTLALTLQITHAHMKEATTVVRNLLALADSNIYAWGARQPSVLVIHVDHSQDDAAVYDITMDMIKDLFAPNDESPVPHLRNSLVAIVDSYQHATVSRKALMNMATHASPTRWIVSGLEVERGLLLSSEASVYATRAARVYADMPGHVFVIPQFASTRDDILDDGEEAKHRVPTDRSIYSGVGAASLPSLRGKRTMDSNLSQYDCVKCGDGASQEDGDSQDGTDDESEPDARRLTDVHLTTTGKNVEDLLEDLWWDLSVADVYGTPGGFSGEAGGSLSAMAEIHDNIEVSLLSLLDPKGEQLEYLQNFDKSPILMIDRLGPRKEMMTLDLAPEVEDFRGRTCFHLLRLAQLAAFGYRVRILGSAFAVSYPKTRDSLCAASIRQSGPVQCDCELDSKGTIKEILMDETKRPAKVAVLMNEHDPAVVKSQ